MFNDTEFEGTESFYLLFTSSDPTIVFNTDSVSDDSASSIRTQVFILDNSGMESLLNTFFGAKSMYMYNQAL